MDDLFAPPTKEEIGDDLFDAPTAEEMGGPTGVVGQAVAGAKRFASAGIGGLWDEAVGGLEAAGRIAGLEGVSGPIKDIRLAEGGPTMDPDLISQSYRQGRDAERASMAQDERLYPGVSTAGTLAGSFMSPINRVGKGLSMAKALALQGGITGFGMSESDDAAGITKDALAGAALGAGLGKGFQVAGSKLAPFAEAASDKVSRIADSVANKAAFKASGARFKDFMGADKERIDEIGKYLRDNKMIGFGSSVDDVLSAAEAKRKALGSQLDDLYSRAGDAFKQQMQKTGFDPIRDKEAVLAAARKELGNAVGAESAIMKLGQYLDEVASRHGDDPMQAALAKYQEQVAEYAPKYKQFLKDKRSYQSQLGAAGGEITQPALPGLADDFQRTGQQTRTFELQGKSPSTMQAEPLELWTQQELVPLPQRQIGQFNPAGGDDLLPMQQQLSLDARFLDELGGNSYQGEILGAQLTPKSYGSGAVPVVNQGQGQMQFAIAPSAPARPVRPSDIRNPMSPRQGMDLKGDIDDAINYARNPLSKEPVNERAFSAARRVVADKIDEAMASLGSDDMAEALREANRGYGITKQVGQMAKDRVSRENANKWIGLTDTIAGAGAAGYGAATGDWQTALGAVAGKKLLEKYGVSTVVSVADRVAKSLMKSPQVQQVAKTNPKVFDAMVINLVERLERNGKIPAAADVQQDNSAQIFDDTTGPSALVQKAQNTKFAQVMQDAAARGEQAVAATNFILQQRDPEYRKAMGLGD